jgi:hypothetical protein
MPLGNGDIGVNLWVEPSGDLVFYVAKGDAWSDWHRLLKVARVRVAFSPNPRPEGAAFAQELRLGEGEIVVRMGALRVRARVDAHHPAVLLEASAPRPFSMRATLEVWRREARELRPDELHSAWVHHLCGQAPVRVVQAPDLLIGARPDRVAWCQRNEASIWGDSLERQGLGGWKSLGSDPLLHLTFGGAMFGEGLERRDATSVASAAPRRAFALKVALHTAQAAEIGEWVAGLDRVVARCRRMKAGPARAAHRAWWREFHARSWVRAPGNAESALVARGYALQRYLHACAGRSAWPIKFNGSLFNVDGTAADRNHSGVGPVQPSVACPDPLAAPAIFDADFRRWGGYYWLQNTRLIYWSMLAAGDFDLVPPFFQFYLRALPFAEFRCRTHHGHGGAHFPETMSLWGGFADSDYGWERAGLPVHEAANPYVRRYWQGGLEVVALMLEWHEHTRDARFFKETLLPFAGPVLEFFDRHYPRDAGGRLRIEPSQSLETWQSAVNPLPEIAGLRWILGRLLEHGGRLPSKRAEAWRRMLGELPPLPMREEGGRKILAPAEAYSEHKNVENPELYAVFPYPLYGVGKPDLELARVTFGVRRHKGVGGWMQDGIQAARLGLTGLARSYAVQAAGMRHGGSRFPGFWGPNYDWVPDQDHGSALMIAVQSMLLQADGEKILLLPAWPADWDVDFRLHAPGRTVVECRVAEGRVTRLEVTPARRRKDVVAGGEIPLPSA